MLCVDVAPTDGAAIQQTLKLLEEKLKSVGKEQTCSYVCSLQCKYRLKETMKSINGVYFLEKTCNEKNVVLAITNLSFKNCKLHGIYADPVFSVLSELLNHSKMRSSDFPEMFVTTRLLQVGDARSFSCRAFQNW